MNPNKMYFLNLPLLPKGLQEALIGICKTTKFSNENLDSDCAAMEYGSRNVPIIPRDIVEYCQSLYAGIFEGGVHIDIGYAKSLSGKPSYIKPHCDWKRRTTINYLLETTEDVTTTLYNEVREDTNLAHGVYLPYDHVTPLFKTVIPENKWHCFNSQQMHSVENLTGDRCYFYLHLFYNPSYEDFLEQYKHLIIDEVFN